ncbi:MAG: hypothetical protein AB7G28_10290 [Pirellulales bacterium]
MTDNDSNDSLDALPRQDAPRRRWLTILMVLVIFLAGMASGAAVTVVYAVNRLQFAIHHPETAPPRIAAAVARRLDLDAEQASRVEAILAAHQQEIMTIRRKFQPEIVAQLNSVRDEVAGVLDAPQRAKWTELFAKFKERWLPQPPAEKP